MSDSASDTQYVPRGVAVTAAWTWRILLFAFAAALLAVVLFELRIVTVPIFVAILLTTLLLPPVHFLRRKGLKPALATAIVFIGALLVVVGIIVFGAATISDQFGQLGPQVNKAIDQVNNWLRTGPLKLSDAQINQYIDQATAALKNSSTSVKAGLVSSATLIGEVLTGILVTLILTFFFTKDGEKISDSAINLFGQRHQAKLHAAAHRAFSVLAGYLRGVAMTGIVDSLLIGIGLLFIGVPLVVPLVILTFFGAFFPLVGATTAGAVAALVALVNGGVTDAVLVVIVVLLVQQVEGHLLQPLLVGRAVALHPAAIIVALVSGSIIAGLLGAFLAVPLTAVVVGVVRELRGEHPAQVVAGGGTGTVGTEA